MKVRLVLSVVLYFCGSIVVSGLRVCGRHGSFNKLDAMHRLLVCLITDKCELDESVSEPERLVQTAKQLIFESNKNMREFRECGWAQIRNSFSIDYQQALNESHLFTSPITTYCMEKEEVCRVHKDFLYPVICVLESKCDQWLAKLIYAFLYGIGQLSAETEGPLECGGNAKFDVTKETIFETRFCSKPSNSSRKRKRSF